MRFSSPWRIPGVVLLYTALAGVWIAASDRIVTKIATDPSRLTQLQTLKGWLFVAFTASLLYFLLWQEHRHQAVHDLALRKSEEKYRTLFEGLADGTLLMTDRVIECNEALCRLWACARHDIIGKHLLSFSPPVQPDGRPSADALAAYIQAARGGIPQLFEWRHRRMDGTLVDVEASVRSLTVGDQRMLEATVRDITARKTADALLRESEARFRELADLLPQTVFEADLHGRLTFSNRNGLDMFRYTQAEFDRGINILHALIPEDRDRAQAVIKRALQGDPGGSNAYTALRADGTTFPVTIYATRVVRNDAIVGLRGMVVDTTEWERVTQAVADHARQLEAVRAVSSEITQELNLATVLPLITQRACQLTGAVAGDLYLWDDQAGQLLPTTSTGRAATYPKVPRRLGEGLLGIAARDRTGIIENDYRNSQRAHPVTLANSPITAALVEPLLYGDRLLGVLGLTHDAPNRTFVDRDQATLRLFASQAAIAIENARLYADAQRELHHRQRAESQLRTIARAVEQTSSIVVITDAEGTIQFVNPRFTDVTGYTEAEALGQNPRLLTAEATSPETYEGLWTTITSGQTWRGELLNQKKNGELYWEDASISPVRDPQGTITHYVAVKDDITERKRTEDALRTRSAQLEAIRTVSTEITQELDVTTLFTLIIQRAIRLLDTTKGALFLWDADQELLVPQVWPGHGDWVGQLRFALGDAVVGTVAQRRQGLIVNDYPTSPYALPDVLPHATYSGVLAEPLLYRDRLLGVVVVNDDTPKRRFAEADQSLLRLFADQAAIAIENARLYREEQVRRRQLETAQLISAEMARELDLRRLLHLIAQRVSDLIRNSRGAVWLWEQDTQTLATYAITGSEEWERQQQVALGEGLVGTVAERRAGQIINDYRTWPHARQVTLERTGITAAMAEPLLYHERLVGVITLDNGASHIRFTEEDRNLVRLFANQAAVAIENARLYTEVNQSFHDLQRAQEELVRAEKLRAIGQLSAGIAHDLNNVLAAVLGQAELLRLKHDGSTPPPELDTIVTAASDGAHIVRRLQDFSRRQPEHKLSAVQLDAAVVEALEITRPRWRDESERVGRTVTIETSVTGLPPILGNATEIREALTNLILNAVDAMPNGGRLTFHAETVAADTDGRRSPAVELSVTDTGSGMDEGVRCRLFEPFFTTKGVKGTGLGLSIVYGIMNRHGGHIDVASTPGQGTTFRLRFQLATASATPGDSSARHRATSPLSILFVDDDRFVRLSFGQLLRAIGHTVFEADSARAGLAQLASISIDLIFTDLGMPEMNGLDFARAVRSTHPTTPILLCTGWNDLADQDDLASGLISDILQKPFSLRQLRDAVERHNPRKSQTSLV